MPLSAARHDLSSHIAHIKHCKLLGIGLRENSADSLVLALPYAPSAAGVTGSDTLSGGALLALMDTVCGLTSAKKLNYEGIAPTLNITIDYVQAQSPGSNLLGIATTYRINQTTLLSRGICYEENNKESPIAFCSGTFIKIDPGISKAKPLQIDNPDYIQFLDTLKTLPYDKAITSLISQSPYAQLLGIQARRDQSQALFILPAGEHILGNNSLPALHGGCIAGFMEHAALLQAWSLDPSKTIPTAINSSIDFLRPARLVDSYATCQIMRRGRKVTNINVSMWQTDTSKRVASASINVLN